MPNLLRDIRDDLRDRLANLTQRKSKAEAELKRLQDECDLYGKMLSLEDSTYKSIETPESPEKSLAEFIVDLVYQRPRTKDEMKDLAEKSNYFQEGEAPGRVIHLTVVNLEKAGRIEATTEGKYQTPFK